MSITAFGLLRHAKTVWNHEGRVQGHWDTELSPEGLTQARNMAPALMGLGFTRVLVSDLGRARDTAAIVNASLKLPLRLDKRLREQDFGDWTGKRLADLPPDELAAQKALGFGFRPPGGESREEVLGRATAALLEAASRNPGRKILVVTHQTVIKCLVYAALGRSYLPGEQKVFDKRCLNWLTCRAGRLEPGELNVSLSV